MDFYLQKARLFALETAKKSQEIATQAAKLSQEIATETAKRSKELAIDVTKRADQLKAYAEELTPSIVATTKGSGAPPLPSEEELQEYGITPELREFVKGLTIKTFRDFPIEVQATDGGVETGPETEQNGDQSGKQDLTPWRERHAVLVLVTVKEISDFRYVLCPRRMNESHFWKIYFTLVKNQIAEYEAAANEKAAAAALEEDQKRLAEQKVVGVHENRNFGASGAHPGQEGAAVKGGGESGTAVAPKNADHDLDAFLMGALDSSDEGADGDGDDDDGFDDFDQLVNSTVDSDGEDDASHANANANAESKKIKQSTPSSATNKPTLAASEVSSDGELVEIPDNESEQASQVSGSESKAAVK